MSKHEKHILREVKTVEKMIRLYCAGKDHCRDDNLCPECNELLIYALDRIDTCPVREEKVFCSECEIHCYRDDMRDRIRTVMRYSGPRMLFHDPIMAVSHLVSTKYKARCKR